VTKTINQGYHSPDRKKFPTFQDKIAENISNKCTFNHTKVACYDVSVMFQLLTEVNSKC